jgi:hypothetical protein
MSSNPNDPTGDPRSTDPDLDDAPEQSSADNAASAEEEDTELVESRSGMGDPTARGVADGSAPTGNLADPGDDGPSHSDDDQINQQRDFADEGYDERQLDGTRAAATERGDYGPATTEPPGR